MSTIKVYDLAGESIGEKEFSDKLLVTDRGEQAVHDVITAYRAAKRAGTASTRTRANVSGGGRKPYKQKGSGNARQGSRRSPILRGGGVVFGPHPRDFSKKVNKKVVALAFRRVLSDKVVEGTIAVAEGLADVTRNLVPLLKKVADGKATLFVTGQTSEKLSRAARNLPDAEVTTASQVNTYQMLRYPVVLTDAEGLDVLAARAGEEE